ncbi:hypothetical protein GCM10007939_12320 [Amylibacter marinus]|uniref:Hedgehog/Intein (Hint) domain-containing protein n=1 Tax=Amylibacter marinus TaxID=1475483 RepID=A0ABQ5VUW5_9RHOB|nr:Hint domain-containing protein [Amylibacter marinus]GLQ34949.1 hypothetical protein GCM10007939_12320 [Amylibacter marinus]
MPRYSFAIYDISDFTGAISSATDTTGAAVSGTSTTFTNSGPAQIFIDDDDLIFNDAFNEPGGFDQILDSDLTIGSNTFNAGQGVELEYSFESDQGIVFFVVRIGNDPPSSNSGQNYGIITSEPLVDGATYTFNNNSAQDGSQTPYNVVCFTRGTKILTPEGSKNIEDLVVGDQVSTLEGEAPQIRWIGSRKFSLEQLLDHPHLWPVSIGRNSLGAAMPDRDLLVSPQHRIYVKDWRADLLYGSSEVLVPAVGLLDGVSTTQPVPQEEVTYYHMLFDRHEVVFANGQPCESFFPGEQALRAIDQSSRDELLEIFPDLAGLEKLFPKTKYPCLGLREFKALRDRADL